MLQRWLQILTRLHAEYPSTRELETNVNRYVRHKLQKERSLRKLEAKPGSHDAFVEVRQVYISWSHMPLGQNRLAPLKNQGAIMVATSENVSQLCTDLTADVMESVAQ